MAVLVHAGSEVTSRTAAAVLAGGNTGYVMLLLGWASEDMHRRYDASAAAKPTRELQSRMDICVNA